MISVFSAIYCDRSVSTCAFSSTRLFRCFLWLNDTSYDPTAKVSEQTNRNMPARNTLVQLLALYTDPESHSAQRHRQTTDEQPDDANSRSYCAAVRSSINQTLTISKLAHTHVIESNIFLRFVLSMHCLTYAK